MNNTDWRFVIGYASYADFSISISPAVERAVSEGSAPPTVHLNIFDKDSITIGVNEDPHQVLNLDFCRSQGITVRRRVNGGGAIYAGKGSAFLAFYLPTTLPGVPNTAAEAFPTILGHLAEGLQEVFGLRAAYRPLNDVEVEGRKLIATSVKIENEVLSLRILLNITPMNTDVAAQAMPMPAEKVRDKKHKDLASRYTYLEREIGRPIQQDELTAWANASVRRAFGAVSLKTAGLTPVERGYADEFAAQLASDAWFYEKSETTRYAPLQQPGDRIGRGREKAPGGLIWVSFLLREGRIVRAIVNGDWHPRPTKSVDWLEQGFAGLEASAEACRRHVEAFLARTDVEWAGVESTHLMKAVGLALADASEAPGTKERKS